MRVNLQVDLTTSSLSPTAQEFPMSRNVFRKAVQTTEKDYKSSMIYEPAYNIVQKFQKIIKCRMNGSLPPVHVDVVKGDMLQLRL